MRRDDRGQLIIAMGLLLAFTLMAIGSNAVFLNYSKKANSYTSTSSSDLSGNPDVLATTLEWKVNSELQRQGAAARNVRQNLNETVRELSDVYTAHGIVYSVGDTVRNVTISRHADDHHLFDIGLTITVDDGVNSMATPYDLTIVGMISDPWPSALASFRYRVPVAFNSGDVARDNPAVRTMIDFASELARLGVTGTLDPATITVVEHTSTGVFARTLPHSYREYPDRAEVLWIAEGKVPVDSYRWYYIYFDIFGGGGTDISPLGDLVVTDDGWVTNARFRMDAMNGSYLRIGGALDIGTGSPSWLFVFDNGTPVAGGWDTWTEVHNSSVYAEFQSTKGSLVRNWTFYANSTLIGIKDYWGATGNRSAASFRTEQLGYLGAGRYVERPHKIVALPIPNSRLTEPPVPDDPWTARLAFLVHHDYAWNFYSYIYQYDMPADVDWTVNSGTHHERMILWQRTSGATVHRYHMYLYYDFSSVGNTGIREILREVESLADPHSITVFHAHEQF